MATKRQVGPREEFFNRIMGSRTPLSMAHAGRAFNVKVTNATHGYIGTLGIGGRDAIQDLYNFNARKVEVEQTANFKADLIAAIRLEMSGDDEGAKDAFNELLNRCQLKTSVINDSGMKEQFSSGEIVKITLEIGKGYDRDAAGNRLETQHDTLVVSSISPLRAETLPAKQAYSTDTLLIAEDEEEAEEALKAAAKPVVAKSATKK